MPSYSSLRIPYTPSHRQILCHNILAAYRNDTFELDVIAAEPVTQLFFTHVFANLAATLSIPTDNISQHSLIELLSADAFDVVDAARKIAYRRTTACLDPLPNSPYNDFPHTALREFVAQSDATLRHFTIQHGSGDVNSPALLPDRMFGTLRAYFNMRYATAVWYIESFPLSGGEAVHFINRESYFELLDDHGSDGLM